MKKKNTHTHTHTHTQNFLGVEAHIFNPSLWEAEADRSLWVPGQPELHIQTLSQGKPKSGGGGYILSIGHHYIWCQPWSAGWGFSLLWNYSHLLLPGFRSGESFSDFLVVQYLYYLELCVHMCCMLMSLCGGQRLVCLSQWFFTLSFEAESLTKPGTHWLSSTSLLCVYSWLCLPSGGCVPSCTWMLAVSAQLVVVVQHFTTTYFPILGFVFIS
jgi:hypothetical protein